MVRLALLALALPCLSFAATAHGTAAGGPIPTGAFATSGVVTSDIVLTDSGVVATGNAVTVNLLGLQHDFAGDLQITLSYIDNNGNTLQSVDIVSRIGVTGTNLYGTAADFGNNQGNGDNYQFNTDYPGNIWAVAACADPPACTEPLGDADSIPGVSTDKTNNGQYFTSTAGGAKTQLSYAFTGLVVAGGRWRLTITDAADPNVGSYIGWEIYITTAAATGVPQTVTAFAGSSQSTVVGTSYASALQAKVTDSNSNPVSGITVTFTAPASGASATLGGASTATAVTNSSGIATSPVPLANATSGSYSVTASVTGLTPAAFSLTNTAPSTAAAIYIGTDSNTLGNWKGLYGSNGEIIPVDSSNIPSYATVSIMGAQPYLWTNATTDPRALLQYSSATARIASTYYGNNFTIDINLTDGNTHKLSLYLCQWDNNLRTESITVVNAGTQAVLSTQTFSNFNGVYAVWNITGHVQIQVVSQYGSFALVNGIFFDPPASATPAPTASLSPASLTFAAQTIGTSSAAQTVTLGNTGTAALSIASISLNGANAADFATTNNCGSTLAAGTTCSISVKFTPSAAGSRTANLVVTDNSGNASGATQTVTLTGTGTTTAGATAIYIGTDTSTLGNWNGLYGSNGEIIPDNTSNIPSYATVNIIGAQPYLWTSSTTDPRALLQYGSTTARIASTYYANSFTIDVNLTDGNTHKLSLYLCQWDNNYRNETITVVDANSQAVLSTQTYSNFNGEYAVWNLSGHVQVQVVQQIGSFALVNGIFFDPPASTTPTPTASLTPTSLTFAAQTIGTTSAVQTITLGNTGSAALSIAGIALSGTNAADFAETNNCGATLAAGTTCSISIKFTPNATGSRTANLVVTDNSGNVSGATQTVTLTGTGTTAAGATATYLGTDTTTLGNWKGVYGTDGEIIPDDSSNIPSYATVNITGAQPYLWTTSTTDPRALLQYSSTTARIASTYYANSFTIDANLTDGNTHKLSLYLCQWDNNYRSETLTFIDANSQAVLSTQTFSNFNGVYAAWNVSGHVQVQVVQQIGSFALVNGVFFH